MGGDDGLDRFRPGSGGSPRVPQTENSSPSKRTSPAGGQPQESLRVLCDAVHGVGGSPLGGPRRQRIAAGSRSLSAACSVRPMRKTIASGEKAAARGTA